MEAVTGHPRVLTTPAPSVFFRAFGAHALEWEIWCFVPQPRDRLATANDLLLQVDQVFRRHNITVPFPQQDVHLRTVEAALPGQSHENGHVPLPTAAARE